MRKNITIGIMAAAFLSVTAAWADTHKLVDKLRDALGSDWKVSAQGSKITATKTGDVDKSNIDRDKLDEETREVEKEHKDVKASINHDKGTLTIRGKASDCSDLADDIEDVAKLDGVKRIEVTVTCTDEGDKGGMKEKY